MYSLPIPKPSEGSSRRICYAHAPKTVVLFQDIDCPLCSILDNKSRYTRSNSYYTSGPHSKVMEDDGSGGLREVRDSE